MLVLKGPRSKGLRVWFIRYVQRSGWLVDLLNEPLFRYCLTLPMI